MRELEAKQQLWRSYGMDQHEPSLVHRACAVLEERGLVHGVVTQNIDTLHERAGSRELIKVHGSSDRVRCASEGCEYGAPAGSLPGVRRPRAMSQLLELAPGSASSSPPGAGISPASSRRRTRARSLRSSSSSRASRGCVACSRAYQLPKKGREACQRSR